MDVGQLGSLTVRRKTNQRGTLQGLLLNEELSAIRGGHPAQEKAWMATVATRQAVEVSMHLSDSLPSPRQKKTKKTNTVHLCSYYLSRRCPQGPSPLSPLPPPREPKSRQTSHTTAHIQQSFSKFNSATHLSTPNHQKKRQPTVCQLKRSAYPTKQNTYAQHPYRLRWGQQAPLVARQVGPPRLEQGLRVQLGPAWGGRLPQHPSAASASPEARTSLPSL